MQMRLIKSVTRSRCLPMLLEMPAATGARRGEVLALRWSDSTATLQRITFDYRQLDQSRKFRAVQ
jgi:integrase